MAAPLPAYVWELNDPSSTVICAATSIRSRAFGGQMETLFENDVRYAKRMTLGSWRRRPTWDRVVQWAVSRGRYLL